MCYRTKLNSKISEIEKAFDAGFIEPELYNSREEINGFDFPKTPVITDQTPGEILMFNWGLIPFWAKDDQIRRSTLNAKIETVKVKPSFKHITQNRCLVIADGFFEWKWLDDKGRKKQKYMITSEEEGLFTFAGIYSIWEDPIQKSRRYTYSILTTQANELMSIIHNVKQRMPVVLHRRDQQQWLSGKDVGNFAFPYEVSLTATEV